MWGAPFGLGLAVFAEELVRFGIGEEWRPAIGLMQAVGVSVAVHQIGFNWDAFYRARGDTRPIAVAAAAAMLSFAAITVPLLLTDGLHGLAIATLLAEAVNLLVRAFYLRRLFSSLKVARHAARALLPSVPAVGAVLLVRELAGAPGSLGAALALLALYVTITLAATAFTERRLVAEILAYVRGRGPAGAAA
jgi:O-antigen/teichoic acid export membrane protein